MQEERPKVHLYRGNLLVALPERMREPARSGPGQEKPSLGHPLPGDAPGAEAMPPDADNKGSKNSLGETGVGVCPN